jgi:hypothetical protein
VYFYIKTKEPITPRTDAGWMTLFINTDGDSRTGWEGYNFAVNRNTINNSASILEESSKGWNWTEKSKVRYSVRGSEMELAIPRAALGFPDTTTPLRFDFKWADDTAISGDIMEFYTNGDTAPNGRFAYRFMEW